MDLWKMKMEKKLIAVIVGMVYQLSFTQTEFACPSNKIHVEPDIVNFCDSLREKQANEMIYARVRITGDTSDPLIWKKRSLYILSKYEFFQFHPYMKIVPADTTYQRLGGGVIVSKETALNLIQEEYVEYIVLQSVPHIPEGPPHWPTIISAYGLKKSVSNKRGDQEIDLIGRSKKEKNIGHYPGQFLIIKK